MDGSEDDIKLDIYLRQFWVDKRLKFRDLKIPAFHFNWRISEKIWRPDTVFLGSRESHLHNPNRHGLKKI